MIHADDDRFRFFDLMWQIGQFGHYPNPTLSFLFGQLGHMIFYQSMIVGKMWHCANPLLRKDYHLEVETKAFDEWLYLSWIPLTVVGTIVTTNSNNVNLVLVTIDVWK